MGDRMHRSTPRAMRGALSALWFRKALASSMDTKVAPSASASAGAAWGSGASRLSFSR